MRVPWMAYLAAGGLVGEVTSALLPRNLPSGERSIGYETVATTDARHITLHMKHATKEAFVPFQNVTVPTQTATSSHFDITSTIDEPVYSTSYISYTKTLSLVENTAHGEKKATAAGNSGATDLVSITIVEKEKYCSNLETVTITVTEVATKPIITTSGRPTLSTPAVSEPSPTAGSIIRIPKFLKAQATQAAAGPHFIGPGPGGWNASTFFTVSTSDVHQTESPGYEVKHAATAVPTHPIRPRVYERHFGETITATIAETSQTVQSRTGVVDTAPTSCGETGYFTINFDDLPAYSPGKNQKAAYPPIFGPYHHFFFSSGWSYGPPPTEPFAPVSNPHIGIYVPTEKKGAEARPKGEFGAGPRAANELFWFDAFTTHAGCDNGNSTKSCELTVKGLKYSTESDTEIPSGTSKFVIPPCVGLNRCNLTQIIFGDGFSGLSGMEIEARVAGKAVMWYIDDVKLRWHDDTCAAGIKRQRSRF
ncbi:uncharacterized protein GIQ15_00472 [Arthroderma uncinatum]|uniref:uncharacterized protein n=1 Tax=Arthroderma uncinatum TaxID=74035 RepID=UPI00144A4F79|nr:uncharacterized protein GIQ15_00472 [Arthroderma uncinatum]KAF3490955.1 hypothetical protein GIQ15_00472 [Arthroderma uncinatum]